MAKINVYKVVNAPKITSAAPLEIKSVGAALNANTKALNNLGNSFSSLAFISGGFKDVAVASLKESKLREVYERRAKQREDDRKREEEYENRQNLGAPVPDGQQKKPGASEKSWLEKTFGGLFGWLAPLAKGAIAFFGAIFALKAFKELTRILSDPSARGKITKFFEKLQFIWDKIFSFGSWLVKDNLLAGFNKVFGKDKTAIERLQGLGQMLIGIVGLSALLNPFGLMMSVMNMMTARNRQMNAAALKLRQREQRLLAENNRLKRQLEKARKTGKTEPPKPRGKTQQRTSPTSSGGGSRSNARTAAASLDAQVQQGAIKSTASGNQQGMPSGRMTSGQMAANLQSARSAQQANPSLVPQRPQLADTRIGRLRQGLSRPTLPTAGLGSTFNRSPGAVVSRLNQSQARALAGQAGPVDNMRLLKKGFINKRTAFKNLSRSAGRGFLRGVPRLASGVYNAPGLAKTALNNRLVKPTARIASTGLRGLGLSANAVKGVLGTVKGLFGRIPWLGVLLTGLFELFEVNDTSGETKIEFKQEALGKAIFKMGGAAIGGVIGSFLTPFIGFLGPLLGVQLGSYGGEMLHMLSSGTEPKVVGQIIAKDTANTINSIIKNGGMILTFVRETIEKYIPKVDEWVKGRIERLYASLDKFKLTDFIHESLHWALAPLGKIAQLKIPNPLQFIDPLSMAAKAYHALFTEKPIVDGKIEEPNVDLPKVKPGDVKGLNEASQDALASEIDQTKTLSSQIAKNYGYKPGQNYYFHHKGIKYRAKLESDGWHMYYDATLFQNKGALAEIPVSTSNNVWLLNAFISGIKERQGATRGRHRNTAYLDFYSADDLNTMKGIGDPEKFDFPDGELTNKQQVILDNIRKKHITGDAANGYYRRDGDGRYLGSSLEASTINLMRMLEMGSGAYTVLKSFPTGAAPSVQRPDGLTPPGEVTTDDPVPLATSESSSGPTIGLSGGKEKAVLDLIAYVEAPGYDSVNGSVSKKPTECTIREIANYAHLQGRSGSGAAGRYQHMPPYISGRAVVAGFNADTKFTPGVQDKITVAMLNAPPHRMQDFLAKKMTAEAFGSVLAGTWRGFPQGPMNAKRMGGTQDQTYSDSGSVRNAAKKGFKWVNFLKKLKEIQGAVDIKPQTSMGSESLAPTPVLDIPPEMTADLANVTANHGSLMQGPGINGAEFDAGVGDKTKRIFLHWTGGFHNQPSTRYHTTFTADGKAHRNTENYGIPKSNHTGGANSNSVGLSLAAMGHQGMTPNYYDEKKGWAESPPTNSQIHAMALEAARMAHAWGWNQATIQSNVRTHGEWERYATSNNILPGRPQRWDLDQLRQGQPWDRSKTLSGGGSEMRALITAYFNKISAAKNQGQTTTPAGTPRVGNVDTPPPGQTAATSIMDGLLVVPPNMGDGNVPLNSEELGRMLGALQEGSLQAFQAPSGAMSGLMEALGKGLNLADAATKAILGKASTALGKGMSGDKSGSSEDAGDDETSDTDEKSIKDELENRYGIQSQVDADGNPIGFGDFARMQTPMDTPLTDTYNVLHKQWEDILGIDPDGDGYKPRDVSRADIFANDYGGRSLSVEQGLQILGRKLLDEGNQIQGTTGVGPIADGDVYASRIPSGYSVGGKIAPLPNNLEGFFLGKVFKSIGNAISGAFNAVKKVVTSITNNPIFKVISTAVSIFIPPLAPIIAGINAVSSLMQGDIIGAVVGGVGALGGMFPGTFGTEAGTFWGGLNKTFGDGIGGVMKGFLTGGIGGAIGGVGKMLPDGIKTFISGMGGFMDKNPMVKNILGAGIAKIPGLGNLLGPALEGAGMSPTMAIDQQATSSGTLISSLVNAGLGLVSKAMGMEQGAISVGALPAALGIAPPKSALMDPKNEALRQMSQMGPIETIHIPIIVEKLVAIQEPVPIITTRVVTKNAPAAPAAPAAK